MFTSSESFFIEEFECFEDNTIIKVNNNDNKINEEINKINLNLILLDKNQFFIFMKKFS